MMYVVLPQALCNGFVGAAFVLAMAWAQTLREHFEGMSWYKVRADYSDELLTKSDQRNIARRLPSALPGV